MVRSDPAATTGGCSTITEVSSKTSGISSGWRKGVSVAASASLAMQRFRFQSRGTRLRGGQALDAPVPLHVEEGQGWGHGHAAVQPPLQGQAYLQRLHPGLIQRRRSALGARTGTDAPIRALQGVPAVFHRQAETSDAQQPGDEHRHGRAAFGAQWRRTKAGM